MTHIAFHFGAPDKLAYACRLLRKAANSGQRVLVVADAPTCKRLDEDLWSVSPADFVSHCQSTATGSVLARANVVLAVQPLANAADFPVLVNMGNAVPEGFDAFKRVIEVVSTDDEDRNQARGRWKQYAALGYTIERHDLNLKGAN